MFGSAVFVSDIVGTYQRFVLWPLGEVEVKRALRPVIFVIAVLYIGVDALFLTIAGPVANWISRWKLLDGLRMWIVSLRPYPTLALFMVPLVVLEPIKPFAAYLVATGQFKVALAMFLVGEILKLVI